MGRTFEEYMASLPEDRRRRIEEEGARLLAEERTLKELRVARDRSQAEIAERVGVNQGAYSKLERRADIYVSTLRKAIEAMGGELDIVARFPDMAPVRLSLFGDLAPSEPPRPRRKKPAGPKE